MAGRSGAVLAKPHAPRAVSMHLTTSRIVYHFSLFKFNPIFQKYMLIYDKSHTVIEIGFMKL
jgi:hypothetical protein